MLVKNIQKPDARESKFWSNAAVFGHTVFRLSVFDIWFSDTGFSGTRFSDIGFSDIRFSDIRFWTFALLYFRISNGGGAWRRHRRNRRSQTDASRSSHTRWTTKNVQGSFINQVPHSHSSLTCFT